MRREYKFFVYIMANKRRGVLYVGVTNNVLNRSFLHKTNSNKNSFTYKYSIDKLVHYEFYQYVNDAIMREKELKKWRRQWKIDLIEKENPEWKDLFDEFE